MYKYEEISEALKTMLTEGGYQPGDLLPDQEKIATDFNTTRVTVRKAIQLLIGEGVVYSKRGAGTFLRKNYRSVSKDVIAETIGDQPTGVTRGHVGHKIVSKIFQLDARLPTQAEQDRMLIGTSDAVYEIRRVRYIDDAVYAYEHTVIPTHIGTITDKVLHASLYEYLETERNLHIAGAHRRISAIRATAEDVEARIAELDEPVLVIEQTSYTDEGEPFEYSVNHYPYATSTLAADVEKK